MAKTKMVVVAALIAGFAWSSTSALATPLATIEVTSGFYGSQSVSIPFGASGSAATASFEVASAGTAHGPIEVELTDDSDIVVGDVTNFAIPTNGYDGFILSVAGSGDPTLGQSCVASSSVACVVIAYGVATDIDPTIGSLASDGLFGGGMADVTIYATPTPEPASLTIMASGIAFLGLRRWRSSRTPG